MEGGWRGVYGRRSVFLPLRVLRGRALADRDTMQPPEMSFVRSGVAVGLPCRPSPRASADPEKDERE